MPSLTAPVQILCYVLVQILLGLASAILFVINCSAFILYGVTALFGPIFIPLLMTQNFKAKFFHFFDVLISFAMIRAVAAAFIYVWAGFLNGFIQQTFNGDYSMEMWLANLIPCTMVFIAFIVNMLFIPSMTQAIFGGAAGLVSAAPSAVRGWGDAARERRSWRCLMKTWFWLAVLPNGRLRWPKWLKTLLALFLLGCLVAGVIYTVVVLNVVRERSISRHVHSHSTH